MSGTYRYCRIKDACYCFQTQKFNDGKSHSEECACRKKEGALARHYHVSMTPYMSPLGGGLVEDRSQRREEMKRNGVREVDPSEFKPTYKNERFINKHGITNQ